MASGVERSHGGKYAVREPTDRRMFLSHRTKRSRVFSRHASMTVPCHVTISSLDSSHPGRSDHRARMRSPTRKVRHAASKSCSAGSGNGVSVLGAVGASVTVCGATIRPAGRGTVGLSSLESCLGLTRDLRYTDLGVVCVRARELLLAAPTLLRGCSSVRGCSLSSWGAWRCPCRRGVPTRE